MVYATYKRAAFKIGDGKDIDLNGATIGNGTFSGTISGAELTANKNAASGYAGLSAAKKLNILASIPSANVRNSHTAVASTTNTAYVKLKTITLNAPLVGSIRIYFEIKSSSDGVAAYGQIYRNGVAIGTERSNTSITYTGFDEDLTISWGQNDTIELWAHGTAGYGASVQNFRLKYDNDLAETTISTTNS